jgi:hypothetical protein
MEVSKAKIDASVYGGIKQFSIFLGNRQKTLENFLQSMHTNQISVMAFSSVETCDYLVLRVVPNYGENLKKLLISSDISFAEQNVLGVEFFHSDDVYTIVSAIAAYEIKIHYMYPLLVKFNNKIEMVLQVEDINLAAKAVHSIGMGTISQEEIDR